MLTSPRLYGDSPQSRETFMTMTMTMTMSTASTNQRMGASTATATSRPPRCGGSGAEAGVCPPWG